MAKINLEEQFRLSDTIPVKGYAGAGLVKKAVKKASEALGEHEGKYLNITQSDRMRVGGKDLGGPGFPTLSLERPEYEGAVWGVGNPSVASTIIGANKRYPEGQALWTTMIGSPEQHRSNQHVFDELHKQFKKSAKAGNLDPVLHSAINNRLRQAVDADGLPMFPEDIDILSKDFKKFADRFDKRAVAADVMAGVGIGGKKAQIFDYGKVMSDLTDPMVKDVPAGSLGYRLFTLSGEKSERPDLHSAFPHILHGEDLGVSYTPAPREIIMQKWIDDFMQKTGRKPGFLDWTRGYAPSTQITEDMLTNLQREGFAKGGEVDKSSVSGEKENYMSQEDLATLLQELARRIQLSGEMSQSREGTQAFGRFGYRQPIGDDMSIGVGASGHYSKGEGYKDAGIDRADMSLSKRFKDESELRARLRANLNEQAGNRGLDELRLEYEIPFKKGGSTSLEEEFRKADMIDMTGFRQDPMQSAMQRAVNQPKKENPYLTAGKMLKRAVSAPIRVGQALGSAAGEQVAEEARYAKDVGAKKYLKDVGTNIAADIAGQLEESQPVYSIYRALKGEKPIREKVMGDTRELPATTIASEILSPAAASKAGKVVKALEGLPVGMSIQDVTPKTVNFVSSVEKAIKGHKMESMNGEQWANWMRANASKSAKKEAEATGLYDWLKSQGKVSKADIEAYVEGNLPQITRIEKGAQLKLTPKDEIRLSELHRRNTFKGQEPLSYDEYNELMRLENIRDKRSPEYLMRQSQMFEESAKKAQAKGDKEAAESLFKRSEHMAQRAEALELNPLEVGGSKFEKWKEPGGEKYRETLLVLPENRRINKAAYDFAEAKGISREEMDTNPDVREAVFAEMGKTTPVYEPSTAFRSKHWDEPNVLMHIRSNERLTPEGKRALFLEELQSDWAQKARKTGIKQDVTDDMLREYHESVRKDTDPSWEDLPSKDKAFLRHIVENRQIDAVPNAPYISDTGDWTKLGLKQALKDAIEGGHDYLAWTTGEQQAKRYDLSKQVSEIAYHPKGKALEVFDIEGNNIINEEGINPEDLADYIGKEAAEKLLNSTEIDRGYNILKGDNIRVGGEGMKAYYDRMVPQYMRDILKQYGIKDDIKPIDVELFPPQRASQFDSPETTGRAPGDIVRPGRYSTQMGIEITPELREKILNEGLPHFKAGGSVDVVPFPRDN